MLKNRYQEILVGLNLMSLVRGLISLRLNRSTLLIDDHRFLTESYPSHFLSELEIGALLRLGKTYDIPELIELRQFLLPATVDFVTHETRLKIGQRPLENLKELLRKFPDLIEASDLEHVYAENNEQFEAFFLEELRRYEKLSFEVSQRPKGMRFEIQGPKWFKTIYERLAEKLNQEYSVSQDLKYAALLQLMGVSFEEKLKTCLGLEEIPFYFFRLLSPIYRLQDFFLTTQLKRRLLLLGGDYKESPVQYWQLHEKKFGNLLLSSFEGVIAGERVLFFSHLPEEVPFKMVSSYPFFRKSQMTPLKRLGRPSPPTALTYMTNTELLGSERPYRVLASHEDMSYYHWPYPELPGSKAEFYEKAATTAFEIDAESIPFEKVAASPKGISGVTLDLRQVRDHRKNEAPILGRLPIVIAEQDNQIQGFEYWGLFRYRTLGLLALCYGVEGI
jgi:hypothetical protein